MALFRRKRHATSAAAAVERLTQEIRKKRQQVHDALAAIPDTYTSDMPTAGRIYDLFITYQPEPKRAHSEPAGEAVASRSAVAV